jgi:hypothetical protein
MVTIFSPGRKLLVLDVIPREGTFYHNHLRAAIAPEFSNQNSNRKQRLDKKQLVVHVDNSTCRTARKIKEYCARKKMTSAPHPVYSPNL